MTELEDGILDGARLLADSLRDSMGVPCCRDRRHYTINQILGLCMRMMPRTAPSAMLYRWDARHRCQALLI